MKENSEEDIKNIEEIIELSKEEIDAKAEDIIAILDIEDLISLKHILSDYKRVLKENEELEEINNELEAEKNEAIRRYNFESIPVSLVEEKIEELDNEKLKYDNDLRIYTLRNTFDFQKEVLQQLLEKEQ